MQRTLGAAVVTAAATIVSVPVQASPLSDIFTSFYAFGDSLTDDGKFGALLPPSFGGRFTNGPTYAEMIAEDFAVSENYALGGATAGPVNTNAPYGTSNVPPFEDLNKYATLGDQVDLFMSELDLGAAGSNPLVSILMGSNDIFQNALDPLFDVTETVEHVITAVYEIAAAGPFDDFIIPLTPGTDSPVYGALRIAYNDYLLSRLADLEADGLNIFVADLDAASDRIDADPEAYGITEEGYCAPSFFSLDLTRNCTFVGIGPSGPIFDLTLANAYPLADPVHPTTPIHTEWAKEITATVQADLSPVPLPAGGVLLLAGLGALGIARRRRA
ncbi:SGNH/GDSL hydrolase family protein [Pseudooceanicola sp. LIPI14-2-Ac024]|uniref:SGNH/GDSL hydrolase family protein n=1 Tax=Pseudooceanicola sp. LIPI14-2-Ac024 TaxID=3344875 RepID=UPI0035D079AE